MTHEPSPSRAQATPQRAHRPPLKVVMLVPYDLRYQPFAIRSIRFADELAQRGHQVTVFHRPQAEEKRNPRAVHAELPTSFTLKSLLGTMRLHPTPWLEANRAIAEADVVHFQKSLPIVMLPALTLSRLHGKPLHQDWDDYEFWFWLQAARDAYAGSTVSPWERAFRTGKALAAAGLTGAAEWLIPKVVDTVGGASAELRRQSVALGAAPSAIFPARVGVDADRFGPSLRDEALRASLGLTGPTVLFSGSLDLHPELHFMVEALKHLRTLVPTAQCLVLGGGFGKRRLKELLDQAGLRDAVVLSEGFVPFSEMPKHLASVDAAALPFKDTRVNRGKSSLTLLECMASGLSVVTHDVGDMAWMLGDGGLLAAPDDPRDFGEKLARVLGDEALRAQLGEKARARALKHFGWAGSVDALEEAYYTAVDRHRAAAAAPRSGP